MAILKLRDEDTGESSMDVVEVPEGLSLQLGLVSGEELGDLTYLSIILGRDGEDRLFDFLLSRRVEAK